MKLLLATFALTIVAMAQEGPALRGTVTDPSGSVVPGAMVQLRGPGGERRVRTGSDGIYAARGLRAGRYDVRYIARGFAVAERRALEIAAPLELDVRLVIKRRSAGD